MELSSVENTLVGDADYLGLSPSQLKRLTIGIELVTNPSVLLADGTLQLMGVFCLLMNRWCVCCVQQNQLLGWIVRLPWYGNPSSMCKCFMFVLTSASLTIDCSQSVAQHRLHRSFHRVHDSPAVSRIVFHVRLIALATTWRNASVLWTHRISWRHRSRYVPQVV